MEIGMLRFQASLELFITEYAMLQLYTRICCAVLRQRDCCKCNNCNCYILLSSFIRVAVGRSEWHLFRFLLLWVAALPCYSTKTAALCHSTSLFISCDGLHISGLSAGKAPLLLFRSLCLSLFLSFFLSFSLSGQWLLPVPLGDFVASGCFSPLCR